MHSKPLILILLTLSFLGTACTSTHQSSTPVPPQGADGSSDQSVRLIVRAPSVLKEGISSSLYRKRLMRSIPRFKKCSPKSEIPLLSIKMILSPQGEVKAMNYVEDDPAHIQVASCLMDMFKTVRFPQSKTNQESEVIQSFRFLLRPSLSN